MDRTAVPAGRETIRGQFVDGFIAVLKEATFVPEDPANLDKLFDHVDKGTIDDIAVRSTPACRVEEGDEEVIPGMYDKTEKSLRFYVHFKVQNVTGVDQSALIDYYFGRIVEVLVMPENFESLGIKDIQEVGNIHISNGVDDPEPGGTIWFDIEYRHSYANYFTE